MFYVMVYNEKFLRDWKMQLMSGSQALSFACVSLSTGHILLSILSLCAVLWFSGKFLKNVPTAYEIRYD